MTTDRAERGTAAPSTLRARGCRLCGAEARVAFHATVLAKHAVDYEHCTACDYLQAAAPHWLDEAYARPIKLEDTGLVQRNLLLSRLMALLLFDGGLRQGRFLDYAGGYGLMTRLMRDYGFDFHWTDPYTVNLFAAGFEGTLDGRYTAISAFEVLEHMLDPSRELGALLEHTDTVIVSTELRPAPVPGTDWTYYGFGHGQHIGFFSQASLARLAEHAGVRLLSDGAFFHAFTRAPGLKLPRGRGWGERRQLRRLRKEMRSLTVADSRRFE